MVTVGDAVALKEEGLYAELPEALRVLYEHQPRDEDALRKEYLSKGLDKIPNTFVLYRIVGNDLYPRHAKGQSRENLRFVLENEPDFDACEKIWILNRIVDPDEEEKIISLLEHHGRSFLRIPFDPVEYRSLGWDFSAYPSPDYLVSDDFQKRKGAYFGKLKGEHREHAAGRAITAAYRFKNNYVMNNNGARNIALMNGKSRAKWVLPWDGNCFITEAAWRQIRSDIESRAHLKYFLVPMERVTDNNKLLQGNYIPLPVEEPQVVFRCDTDEVFNEEYCYGRRPKVELFWRLNVPGQWNSWRDDPWDQPRRALSKDHGQFGVAGWVARMFSGMKSLELGDQQGFKNRGRVRQDAIIQTINRLEKKYRWPLRRGNYGLVCFDEDALIAYRTAYSKSGESSSPIILQLIQDAEESLERGPYSVTDKTTLPPSGDIHDYWHPAPYWWPNPNSPDGLPYVRKDGHRVPGTKMYEEESDRYDRTRLQRLFDDVTSLSLAWFISGKEVFAEHAVRLIRTWFLDPSTAMNPHLKYAQVRMGHDGDLGNPSGVIEMKDVYYFLDAVRVLQSFPGFSGEEASGLKGWFERYLVWLTESEQGRSEAAARNNHGIYYDLQVLSIASFLDDLEAISESLIRAEARLTAHFDEKGVQVEELTRTQTAHYCAFNLQGWLNFATVAEKHGSQIAGHRLLRSGVNWLLAHAGQAWPYPQVDDFNRERLVPIYHAARQLWIVDEVESAFEEVVTKIQSRFHPHDGVRPYWNLSGCEL